MYISYDTGLHLFFNLWVKVKKKSQPHFNLTIYNKNMWPDYTVSWLYAAMNIFTVNTFDLVCYTRYFSNQSSPWPEAAKLIVEIIIIIKTPNRSNRGLHPSVDFPFKEHYSKRNIEFCLPDNYYNKHYSMFTNFWICLKCDILRHLFTLQVLGELSRNRGVNGRVTMFRFPAGQQIFHFSTTSRPTSYTMWTQGSFP
jgi:hypothetical protein